MALISGEPIPARRLRIALCDAPAVVIHSAEAKLREWILLSGRETQPTHSLGVVLGESFCAIRIPEPEVELRPCVTLLSQHTQFVQRQLVEVLLCVEECAVNERSDDRKNGG